MLLDLGAEIAVFQKPNKMGQHMKPLYIKGYLDGEPINHMLVDTGACVNIMPHVVFEKLGHHESELMKTNMVLNGFSGEASEAKGIISKELTVSSKTVPMAFFVVDVKGKYNVLLGREWIHTNGCVPSTLH
jgi:predicted aspartyl protease